MKPRTSPAELARRLVLQLQLRRIFDSNEARALRNNPWRDDPHAVDSAGHCYIACEVLWHALGAQASGLLPCHLRHEGASHWYLRDVDTGAILDPTADQFHRMPTDADYARGRGCGFLTRAPSKRARQLAALASIAL